MAENEICVASFWTYIVCHVSEQFVDIWELLFECNKQLYPCVHIDKFATIIIPLCTTVF